MDKNLKNILFIAGLVLFLISFILPAFSDRFNVYGYQAAVMAFALPFQGGLFDDFFIQILYRIHFLLLAIHNILLPVVVFLSAGLLAGKRQWLIKLYLLTTLNVLAFYVVNLYSPDYEVLLVGYYVWAVASVCVAVPFVYKQLRKQE